MTLADAAQVFATLAEGCSDVAVGEAIQREAEASLPALVAATPRGSGLMARSWRVVPGADVRGRVLTNEAYYSGLVRERGARVLPEGHPVNRPGWHWDRPPVYLTFAAPIVAELERRLNARIRNITAPYIPVLEDY